MYYVRTAAAAVAFAIVTPAYAQDDGIERGPRESWIAPSALLEVPEDATGPVFVRRQDTLIHLLDGSDRLYTGWRIKLLNPAALQLGNISLSWNPSAGAPVLHSLKIYRDGAVIDLTQDANFEVLRREDRLELSMLTGILTAVYNVPDLRVGDELEFETTTASTNPTFPNHHYGLLTLADQPPPGRFQLQLSWTDGEKPATRPTADLDGMISNGTNELTIAVDNPSTIRPPKDAPPRYSWMRILEYSDFQSWPEISSRFATLYREAAQLPEDSPLRAEVDRIAAANPTGMGRAKAALKLVQDQIRYVYVGLNAGNLSPASAEETWQRRYGDCKGKTALLMALLGELGIPAEAVMANITPGGDDGLEQRLPSPLLFDHVLVRATIDGESYWLDGTLPSVATPSREPRGEFRNVLPYREQGSELENLPWKPARLPFGMSLQEIDASAGFDEPARWTITNVSRGIQALQLYAAFSAVPRSQFATEIANSFEADGTLDEVESATWRFDEPTSAMIMTVSGRAPVEWEEDAFGYQFSLPGGGFNPPARRTRPSSQDGSAPFYSVPDYDCSVTTLVFPSGTKTGQWSYNSEFDQSIFGRRYTRRYDQRSDSLTMVRSSLVERLEIDPQEAAKDNARIDDFDNSMANIIYDKTESLPLVDRNDLPVATAPAWEGPSPACLPG